MSMMERATEGTEGVTTPLRYDFHGAVSLTLEPGPFPSLERKWSHCRAGGGRPDLTIARGVAPGRLTPIGPTQSYSQGVYRVTDGKAVYDMTRDRIACDGKIDELELEHGIVCPTINRTIVPRGSFLFYSAAVSYQGSTLIMPSIGSSGKTSIVLEFLGRGASYVADNDCFLDGQGRCGLYSPAVTLSTRHLAMFPELRPRCLSSRDEMREFKRHRHLRDLERSLKGKDRLSSLLRTGLESKAFYRRQVGIERLFPDGDVVRGSKLSHSFLLCPQSPDLRISSSDGSEMARIIAARSWLRRGGERKALADMAGIPHYTWSDSVAVLEEGLKGAECHRMEYGQISSRKDVVKIVDLIEGILS